MSIFTILTKSNIRCWLENGEEVPINDITSEYVAELEHDLDLIHFTKVSSYGVSMEMVRIKE